MPTANAIHQADISVAQLKAFPHSYISPPNAPGACRPTSGHSPITAPTGNQFGAKTANTGQICVNEKTTRTAATYRKLGHSRTTGVSST